jgi:hypothetical protein
MTEMAVISALPSHLLEIYAGSLPLRLIFPAFRMRPPLGHHASNRFPS